MNQPAPPSGEPSSWLERPALVLLAGVALLGVCGVCVYFWVADSAGWARAAGGLSGAAGIYLTVGGVLGIVQGRNDDTPPS